MIGLDDEAAPPRSGNAGMSRMGPTNPLAAQARSGQGGVEIRPLAALPRFEQGAGEQASERTRACVSERAQAPTPA
jgi:hypothetical protein